VRRCRATASGLTLAPRRSVTLQWTRPRKIARGGSRLSAERRAERLAIAGSSLRLKGLKRGDLRLQPVQVSLDPGRGERLMLSALAASRPTEDGKIEQCDHGAQSLGMSRRRLGPGFYWRKADRARRLADDPAHLARLLPVLASVVEALNAEPGIGTRRLFEPLTYGSGGPRFLSNFVERNAISGCLVQFVSRKRRETLKYEVPRSRRG